MIRRNAADIWRTPRPQQRLHVSDLLHIEERRITSPTTQHHADRVDEDRWHVDYLPGRPLTYRQAVRAMEIAAALRTSPPADIADIDPADDARVRRELGLTMREAVGLAAMSLPDHDEGLEL